MEILKLQRSLRCVKLSRGRALPIFSNTHIFSSVIQWLEFSKWVIMTTQFRESVHTEVREKWCQAKTDIHFECTDTDTQNKQKTTTKQTPPRQVPVKHDHMSPGEQGHTAQPSSGWQRDVIVEGGIGGIAHPFRSGLANMMRSENAIFKKRKKWLDACSVVIEEGQMG